MFKEGAYTAWFRTSLGQGTAIVRLAEGRISGGDCFFSYGGCYQIEGEQFTATLTTKRCADGPTTVLGLDEVELKLSGMFKGSIGSCTGRAAEAPGIAFEATLFPSYELSGEIVQPPLDTEPASTASKIARLPKAPGERYRPRHPR